MHILPFVAMGLALGGTALSAYGTKKAADEQAKAITDEARIKESDTRDRLKTLLGRQAALYAAAGVDIGSGSPLLVMKESALEGNKEAISIHRRGEKESDAIKRAGTIGAVSTALSGLGSAAFSGYNMGMFGSGTRVSNPAIKNPYSGRMIR